MIDNDTFGDDPFDERDYLPTDTYYRGYRLSLLNGGDSAGVKIYAMGDPDLLHVSPDEHEAREVIDSWLDAP